MDIAAKLQALASEVEQKLPAARRSEANTSLFLVQPFFEALGYSVHNPNDVEPEFTADVGIQRERVDYALKVDGKAAILVEVKYAGASLDNQHAAQLRRYFSTKLDIHFGILTNGREFRFFSDLDRPNVMDDEPFFRLNLQDFDETSLDVLAHFAKSRFRAPEAVQAARRSKDRQRIRQALKAQFDPLSQEAAAFILATVVPSETGKSRREELTRLLREEWRAFLGLMPATPDEPSPKPIQPPPDSDYIPVHGYYEEYRFEAELSRQHLSKSLSGTTRCIRYKGERVTAAEAAFRAIRSVNPTYEYSPARLVGLAFWHVVDPADGEEHPLSRISWHHGNPDDAFRQRILSS